MRRRRGAAGLDSRAGGALLPFRDVDEVDCRAMQRLGDPHRQSHAGELRDAQADESVRSAISLRHGEMAGALPGPHRDPFDRMLIAQAMLENLVLVSNEQPFDVYGIGRLW
jgi:PIN domain nuclease of toxin-antitoxin system